MTKNSKRPADIRTDRTRPELPILDRLLPLDTPTPSADRRSATDEPGTESGDAVGGGVSMNAHCLDYEQPQASRAWGRRFLGALLPALIGTVAVGALVVPVAAGAQTVPGQDLDIKSVRFDLPTDDAPGVTAYRSMVVTEGGVEHHLQPMSGSVRVTMSEPDAAAVTAVIDGQPFTLGATDFTASVATALSSRNVTGFLRIGVVEGGAPVSIDVFYDRPLGPGDHVLIQESNGDGAATITALDAAGVPTGVAVTVGSPYQVNTGHNTEDGGGASAWASIVDVRRFNAGATPISGIRVAGANLEVKAMALVAAESTSSGLVSSTSESEAPVYASVGLEAKVQPALAVDGAGCLASPASAVSVGQAATFCFLVTNLGTTNLTDIRITDPQLGLVNAVLPMASGQPDLAPGAQAVLFHHTVAGERSDQVNAIVSARPVDGGGNPITNLIAPTGVGSPGTIGVAAVQESVEQTVSETGALTPGVASSTEMAEVSATRAINVARPEETDGATVTESAEQAPTQLAMTGVPTEPWILVILAMGLIFVGYTAFAAFNGASRSGEVRGHDQLDFLGFD